MEIVQFNAEINYVSIGNFRSKGNIVFNRNGQKDFVFTTLLYPFKEDNTLQIDFTQNLKVTKIDNWTIFGNDQQEIVTVDSLLTDARHIILMKKTCQKILLDVSLIKQEDREIRYTKYTNLILRKINGSWQIDEMPNKLISKITE